MKSKLQLPFPHRWRVSPLLCIFPLLLAGCGGGGGGDTSASGSGPGSLVGRVETTGPLGGANVTVERVVAGGTFASQLIGSATTTATGLFSVDVSQSLDAVRVTAEGVDVAGHPTGRLSAYAEKVDPESAVIHVNTVTTLADRVRTLGNLSLADAEARVADFLELGESPERSFSDDVSFNDAVFLDAQAQSGLDFNAYVDQLAQQLLADPQARHPFLPPAAEPAWDDTPLLQAAPFGGDIAAAIAMGALSKVSGSAMGSILSSLGVGSDAQVQAQLAEINRKLDALGNAVDLNAQLVRESKLTTRLAALKPYVDRIRTAQTRLEAVATYRSVDSREEAARRFNKIVEGLLDTERAISSELIGDTANESLVKQYIALVWADPTQKFYSWKHQERILAFLDYYDTLNASLYLLYANYYRGMEAGGKDLSELMAELQTQFESDRAKYRALWPERLDDQRMFVSKGQQAVYSGVLSYGPAEQRVAYLRNLQSQGQAWFMPTTKYYEQENGITNATGQKLTQWLYRDFLDFAASQKKSIGQAVVDAGAPAALAGTGKNAIFLLNEDVPQRVCTGTGALRQCALRTMGYEVFDLANPSKRDYQVYRPLLDISKPIPGNYHYIFGRPLTADDRARWKIPG